MIFTIKKGVKNEDEISNDLGYYVCGNKCRAKCRIGKEF